MSGTALFCWIVCFGAIWIEDIENPMRPYLALIKDPLYFDFFVKTTCNKTFFVL